MTIAVVYPRIGKVKRFLLIWRNGRRDHFPICCIFRFAVENAFLDGKTVPRFTGLAVRRGVVETETDVFVPCNIFHHKTKAWEML